MANTINISLPENLKAEVDSIVTSEGYGNTSEFFRELIRKYIEDRRIKNIEDLIIEGLESGKASAFTTDDLASIRKKGKTRLRKLQGNEA